VDRAARQFVQRVGDAGGDRVERCRAVEEARDRDFLAAFSTAAALPPAASASNASCRQGKRAVSGASKVSCLPISSSADTPASMRSGKPSA
jgi:hypothetical protein